MAVQSNDNEKDDGPAAGQPWRRVAGLVRNEQGAAVAGAEVYLEAGEPDWGAAKQLSHFALPIEQQARWQSESAPGFRLLGRARSDADGRFVVEPHAAPEIGAPLRLVAAAKDYALAGHAWDGKAGDVEIRLPKPVAIHGRLLKGDGAPAAGAVVKATSWYRGDIKKPIQCLYGVDPFQAEKDYPPYWPRPVVADADGRFTINGMPGGCHVTLDVSGASFAREELTIDTGQGPTAGSRAFERKPLPPDFTHTLGTPRIAGGLLGVIVRGVMGAVGGPTRPVEGTVTEDETTRPVEGTVTAADTGKPMAGILVDVTPMRERHGMPVHTRTDATGHYRVSDKAGDSYFVTAYPPPDSGYLAESANGLRWPTNAQTLVQDFQLKRGVFIPGRVIDGATGKPLAGASVEYHSSPKNPHGDLPGDDRSYEFRTPVLTDREGRFKLIAVPGAGYLSVETGERIYIRTPVVEGDRYRRRLMLMGYTPIDVPSDATASKEVTIRLERGRTVTLQAVGPNGKHLPAVRAGWEGSDAIHTNIWHGGKNFREGKIVVEGVDPKRTTRVFMMNVKQKLGAAYDITADTPAGPVEVRLQPNATIAGQAVDAAGKPTEAQVYLKMSFDPQLKQLVTSDPEIFAYEFYTNFTGEIGHRDVWPGGRFTLDNVLPGIPLAIVAAHDDGDDEEWAAMSLEPLRPGERRDAGNLTLTKRKQQ